MVEVMADTLVTACGAAAEVTVTHRRGSSAGPSITTRRQSEPQHCHCQCYLYIIVL